MTVTGKVCVITGASSGIGERTALDMASDGASVCVVARREQRLAALVDRLGGRGADHSYVRADVSRRDDVRMLAEHVNERYGRLDVLVNNAGLSRRSRFESAADIEDVESIMATNFYGAVYCMGELMPLLMSAAPSHVVNVASMAGRLAVGVPSYTASKFALVGFSEALQPQLARKGVYVSLIEPGFIPTEGFPQDDLAAHPVLRHALGTVEQVSAAILDAIDGRKPQRVTPRWYYLAQVPRVLTPRLFRMAQAKLSKMR